MTSGGVAMGKMRMVGVGVAWLAVIVGFFMIGVRRGRAFPVLPACARCACLEVGAWYDPGGGVAYALQINGSHVTNAGQIGIDSGGNFQNTTPSPHPRAAQL